MKKDNAKKSILDGKYRYSVIALMVAAGVGLLAFSYYQSNLAISFAGLGLIIWGTSLVFVTSTKMIKARLITSQMSSLTLALNRLLEERGYDGSTYFLPPKLLGESPVQIIESKSKRSRTSIIPTGLNLEAFFEEEANIDFFRVDLPKLQELLVKVIVDRLDMASTFRILKENERITIMMKDFALSEFYANLQEETPEDHPSITCPTVSALACALAKSTRKVVLIEHIVLAERNLEIRFRLFDKADSFS
jgi:hypothetical protein